MRVVAMIFLLIEYWINKETVLYVASYFCVQFWVKYITLNRRFCAIVEYEQKKNISKMLCSA